MKKIIRMASVCVLAGAALLTGCTKDYSMDITELQKSVSSISATQTQMQTELKSLTDNVTTLTNSVKTINETIAKLQTSLNEKEAALKAELAKKANQTDLDATNAEITAIKKSIADLQKVCEGLQEQITACLAKFAEYCTKDEFSAAIAAMYTNAEIDKLIADAVVACKSYTDAEVLEAIAKCNGYTDTELKAAVEKINAAIEAALKESKQYTDEELADALAAAKLNWEDYANKAADAAKTAAVDGAKLYTDSQVALLYASLQNYTTDEDFQEALKKNAEALGTLRTDLTEYTDGKFNDIIETLKNYVTVAEFNAALEDLAAYADEVAATAQGNSQVYTDEQIAALSETLTEAIEAAKLVCNNYTDSKIADLVSDLMEEFEACKEYIDGKYIDLNGKISGLSGTVEDYNTALNGKIAALSETLESYKTSLEGKIEAAKKEAIAYAERYTNQEIKNAITVLRGELEAAVEDLDTKITNLETSLKKYTDDAIAGISGGSIKELKEKIESLSYDLEAVRENLDKLSGSLRERIQSIVFVPQYTKNNSSVAVATKYFYNGKELQEGLMTVEASYRVEPSAKSEDVLKALANGDAQIVYVYTETKAAGEVKTVAKEKTHASYNKETGNIDIFANITEEGTKAQASGKSIAVALQYELADSAQISSSFVPVVVDENAEIGSEYILINEEGKEYPKDNGKSYSQIVKKPWDVVPATVNWFEGYKPAIKHNGTVYEPVAFGELIGLDKPENLVPSYNVLYTDRPVAKTGALVFPVNSKDKSKAASIVYTEDYTQMVDDTEKTRENVGEKAFGAGKFYLAAYDAKAAAPVMCVDNQYEIIRRTLTLVLEGINEVIPWTYKLAQTLSSVETWSCYLDQVLGYCPGAKFTEDKDFNHIAVEFKEQKIASPATFTDEQKNTILKLLDTQSERNAVVYVNDKEVKTNPLGNNVYMTVDDVAIIKSHLAGVQVFGYWFNQGVDNNYKFINSYKNDTDSLSIEFKMTLGAAPKDETVAVPESTIDFVSGKLSSSDKTVSFKSMYDKIGGEKFFNVKQYDEFLSSLFNNAIPTGSRWSKNAKDVYKETKFTSENASTNLKVYKDQSVYTLNPDHVTAFADYFTFSTSYATWYHNNWTFTGKFTLVKSNAHLEFWPDRVNEKEADLKAIREDENLVASKVNVDGIGTLVAPEQKSGTPYKVENDDLSRYFKVKDVENAASTDGKKLDKFYVLYSIDPLQDKTKAPYVNLPEVTGSFWDVYKDESIETEEIKWEDYANRALLVKAELMYGSYPNGLSVTTKTLLLRIDAPVKISTNNVEKKFAPNTEIVMNLAEGLSVKGIRYNFANELVKYNDKKPKAALKDELSTAPTVYGLTPIMPTEKDIIVTIGTMVRPLSNFPNLKLVWNADGYLTYQSDSATLENDVVIDVPVKFSFRYMYWGSKNDSETVYNIQFKITNNPTEAE